MLDLNYRPVARINAGVRVCQITFYAISLRHLEQRGERLPFGKEDRGVTSCYA